MLKITLFGELPPSYLKLNVRNYHSLTVLTHAPSNHRLNRQAKNIFLSYDSLVVDLIGQLS